MSHCVIVYISLTSNDVGFFFFSKITILDIFFLKFLFKYFPYFLTELFLSLSLTCGVLKVDILNRTTLSVYVLQTSLSLWLICLRSFLKRFFFFDVDHFLMSLLNLLQYCFCFSFLAMRHVG